MRLQQQLPLSQTDTLDVIHGVHDSGFVLARKSADGWSESLSLLSAEGINEALLYRLNDAYFSVSGVKPFKRRRAENISELTCHYLDIDSYKLGIDPDSAITQTMMRCDELGIPVPTWFASSGRGVYAFWLFSKPYHLGRNITDDQRASRLGAWSYCQSLIVKAFADIGADPVAKDVSRVLRLPESINSHNGQRVAYYAVGDTIGNAARQLTTPLRALFENPKQPKLEKPAGEAQKRSNTKSLFSLCYARMMDITKLAALRGGKFTDNQDRAIFAYACAASINAPTDRHLVEQVRGFVEMRIADAGGKYTHWERYIGTLLERYRQSPQSAYDPDRVIYKMRNQTIIDWLEITPDEQRQLSSIIGKDEKKRRRNLREGRDDVETYRAKRSEQSADKRTEALRLRDEGMSNTRIAEALGVTTRSVRNYLK